MLLKQKANAVKRTGADVARDVILNDTTLLRSTKFEMMFEDETQRDVSDEAQRASIAHIFCGR